MPRQENEQLIKAKYFDAANIRLTKLSSRFATDPETIIAEAATTFDAMLPTMAYVDKPEHPFAPALFTCNVNLSLYLALKQRGVNAHAFGSAMINGLMRAPIQVPPETAEMLQEKLTQFAIIAKESQTNAQPGEDIIEVVEGEDFDWGYNVKSCAICHSAAKYDAMDVVPYMCAVDDVISDKGKQGLRRTGSIALGATHCDFRYKNGGQPQRLAEQYPDQIHSADNSTRV